MKMCTNFLPSPFSRSHSQFFFVLLFRLKKNNPLPWCAASRCRLCANAQRFERPNEKLLKKRAGVTVTLILNVHHVERRGVNCKQEVPEEEEEDR